MSEQLIELSYLNDDEIISFYELFFGKILIKKSPSLYLKNLQVSLTKENFIEKVVERLNSSERIILEILSFKRSIPYHNINEKLSIILEEQASVIGKHIQNLIERNYIFLRDEKFLIIPDIYFPEKKDSLDFSEIPSPQVEYSFKTIVDINNIINYILTKDFAFSKSERLYKKDFLTLYELFSSYAGLEKSDYDLISYVIANRFYLEGQINIKELEKYFSLPAKEQTLYFIKHGLPAVYHIIDHFYTKKQSALCSEEHFEQLWTHTLLLTDHRKPPFKMSYDSIIDFLEKTGLITLENNNLTINYYEKSAEKEDFIQTYSNYSFYLHSDTTADNAYFPALFSEYKKYDRVVEYDITEQSVKKAILNGLGWDDVKEFFDAAEITLSPHVETTLTGWFNKYGSFYYVTGTVFFCETKEKGKIISKLIESGMIKAQEIKKDRTFLIPEEEKAHFFSFLEKSSINFYEKKTKKPSAGTELSTTVDIESLL